MCRIVCLCLLLCCQAASLRAQQLVIKKQKKLDVRQGESITISLNDIDVDADRSLNYPNGFYLIIDDGENYNVSGNTITPSSDYEGDLRVPIRVSNGTRTSDTFQLKVKVKKRQGSDDDEEEDDDDDDDDDDEDDGDDGGNDGNGGGGGGNNNQHPTILNQVSISINKNQTFKIELAHLVVSDPDNNFPADFTLKIQPGNNYSVSGSNVTPVSNFVGTLTVSLKVNDGEDDSNAFPFKITVVDTQPSNVAPIITGQSTLTTFKNESLTVRLADLIVTDPDDTYPTGFTLNVSSGTNYSVSGYTVTPAANFLGQLTIPVNVHDGAANSNTFNLRISVVERARLQILGQTEIRIAEDSAYTFKFGDLRVSDPSGSYPSGFTMTLQPGNNYTVNGMTIRPAPNFFGTLKIPTKVSKGTEASNAYEATIVVTPVNDPPSFTNFDDTPLIAAGQVDELELIPTAETADVDDQLLSFAEIRIDSTYLNSTLAFVATGNIDGQYDSAIGVLVLQGEASLTEYNNAIRSVSYSSIDSVKRTTTITFRLNDGSDYSEPYRKVINNQGQEIDIFIPSAFTPNSDDANDTWVITVPQPTEETNAQLRIYNDKGFLLYEAFSLVEPWNGTYNGELLAAGSYFYTLIVTDGKRRARRNGVVTILR